MSNQKIAENQELDDLKKILSTEEGGRFFWRLFEFCGLYRSPATGDRQSTDINIGQNNVALWALGEALEAHPQAIARLIVKNQTMEHKND